MAGIKFILTDAAGNDLNDSVTIDLYSLQTSKQYQHTTHVKRSLLVNGIDATGGPTYRVMVTPANHRILQFFVMPHEGKAVEHAARVPVNPAKVLSIDAPPFDALPPKAQEILAAAEVPEFQDGAGSFLQGEPLYAAIDRLPLLKACFLNIAAKSASIQLQDGRTCLDHYLGLMRLNQDRLFIPTTAALVEEMAQSNAFHAVSPALHLPLAGYHMVASYKTFDHYANLQLTFQRRGEAGDDYVADVDIDDAQGIEHAFQVIRNSVTGPTNPYDIHEILLQQDPPISAGYEFAFAPAVVSKRAAQRASGS
jgi:hypothetical protein